MFCPNCNQPVTPGATFCGNCGFALTPNAAQPQPMQPQAQVPLQPQPPMPPVAPGQPQPQPPMPQPVMAQPQPQFQQQGFAPQPPMPAVPGTAGAAPTSSKRETEAGLALGLGILGCIAWLLMLVLGLIAGILAIVFGTMSIKSRRKGLAIAGIVLGVLAIAVSLFFWVKAAQNLEKTGSVTGTSDSSTMQTITTPCYTTKIPANLKITRNNNSCSLQAEDTVTREIYLVQVNNVSGLTAANASSLLPQGVESFLNGYPGSSVINQNNSTFSSSPAYTTQFKDQNGDYGTFDFVYHTTAQGNLIGVLHLVGGQQQYNLDTIENNWSWE